MDLFIDFDKVDEFGPQKVEGRVELSPSDAGMDEVERFGDVDASVRADKGDVAGEYLVEGEVKYAGDLRCARCLDPYPFANSTTFAVRFRPSSLDDEEAQEVELAEGELDVEFYESRQIPLRDIALEQIGLALPMKPLCEETCRGLCLHCGANLNRGACDCRESLVDNRWDALKGIREELEKKKDV
jgi:uncharacterized protein